MGIHFRGRSKTEVLSLRIGKPLTLKIDPEIVRNGSAINITVFPIQGTDYIGVTQNDVKIFSPERFCIQLCEGYSYNLFEISVNSDYCRNGVHLFVCACQYSGSLSCLLCGHILDFIKDFSLLIQRHDVHEHALPTMLKKPDVFLIYLDYIAKSLWSGFRLFCRILKGLIA